MEKTPVLVDTNILSTFAKIKRLELLFKIMDREELYISTSVLHELDIAENIGYDFVQTIFDYIDKERISILSMDDEESDLFLNLPDSFGRGERESVAISKSRDYIFVSNETKVKNYCDRNDIDIVDLPTLLRRAWKVGLKEKETVKNIVEEIEDKDNIIFKDRSIIFEE
ncbi:MAG: hypothetical protein ACQEQM_03290 [Thermoplasmatota archaeon]